MVIHIQNRKNSLKTNRGLTKEIHSIPFKLLADCDADVSKYFLQTKSKSDLKYASFRGYPLVGKELRLPNGYRGLVLHEMVKPSTEIEDRKFYMLHNFDNFTYWNWGTTPCQNDTFVQAMDWIDIAEALHSPIDEEADQKFALIR